jgi:uncharacterized protein (DUF1499 family)
MRWTRAKRDAMIAMLTRIGFWLAVACALAAAMSGIGYRSDWWPLAMGFGLLRWSAYGAIAATVLGIVGTVATRPGSAKRGFAMALAAAVIGTATWSGPAFMLYRARQVPPIHDITTDTANPPRFVAVVPLRPASANTLEYGGPDVAALQSGAYPKIIPVVLNISAEAAFAHAVAVARDMGWTIQAVVPAEGRIEATDTTPVFGFKDDIVIRVAPAAIGSRVDIRSQSRVGRSDIGANAKRIERFLERLAKTAGGEATAPRQ